MYPDKKERELSEDGKKLIRNDIKSGLSTKEIANKFDCSETQVAGVKAYVPKQKFWKFSSSKGATNRKYNNDIFIKNHLIVIWGWDKVINFNMKKLDKNGSRNEFEKNIREVFNKKGRRCSGQYPGYKQLTDFYFLQEGDTIFLYGKKPFSVDAIGIVAGNYEYNPEKFKEIFSKYYKMSPEELEEWAIDSHLKKIDWKLDNLKSSKPIIIKNENLKSKISGNATIIELTPAESNQIIELTKQKKLNMKEPKLISENWLELSIEEKVKKFDEVFDNTSHLKRIASYERFKRIFSNPENITPENVYQPHEGKKDTLHHMLEYDLPGRMRIGSDETWISAKQEIKKIKQIIEFIINKDKTISEKFDEALNINLKYFKEGAISKLISAFYPKEVVPIFNNEHKKWFLQILGLQYKDKYDTIGKEYEDLNYLLIKARNRYCPNFDLAKFMEFLYEERLFFTPKTKIGGSVKRDIEMFMRNEKEKILSKLQKENDINKLLEEAKNYSQKTSGYCVKKAPATLKQRIDDEKQKGRIKKIENFTCQIKKCSFNCSYKNKSGDEIPIIHAHHIKRKNLGGNEDIKNIIILCPNCHAKADNGIIKIDTNKKLVTENGQILEINDNHLFVN